MMAIYQTNPNELKQWLEAEEAILIDVREPAENRAESIAYARNLPLSDISMDAAHLPEHRHKKLVIHCKSGKRSMMACEKLKKEQVSFDVWNLAGGIEAWKAAGLPTEKSDKKVLPLDRQVQLAIGLMILIGLGIVYSGNIYGWILPFIAGIGLTNAGLTGWCGLAKLIANMPWNR